MINNMLKKYIADNIFPIYQKNDLGHNLNHINYVIARSLNFARKIVGINYDMVYTVASYHDIGHYIDAENHEKVSTGILLSDKNLTRYFDDEQIRIIAEAICDHRASLKIAPKSIYGKILSSADRNTSPDIALKRMYAYLKKNRPNDSVDKMIEDARKHMIKKFGSGGYAIKKIYFEDISYKKFLECMSILASDKKEFRKKFIEVNNIF